MTRQAGIAFGCGVVGTKGEEIGQHAADAVEAWENSRILYNNLRPN